jgi:hypothetical protein
MTKEEIIEIANKVKLPHDHANGEPMWLDKLEEFAKLVAEHEREKCAKIAEWHKQMAFDIRARGQE